MTNLPDLRGKVTGATVRVPLSQGLFATIDAADEPLVMGSLWHAARDGHTVYAKRNVLREDGRYTSQRMHELLTGWPRTDHNNGDGLDNRRANLRPANRSQNMHNRRKGRGSSIYKGVSWDGQSSRWKAYICTDGRIRNLGRFVDEVDAAWAYDAAARQLFGEFAALNLPMLGERSAISSNGERGIR